MIGRRYMVLALTGACTFALIQPAASETLREAVSAALANHPAVEIAQSQKQIESEKTSEVYSGLFPEISTSATGGRVFGNNSTTRGLSVSRGEAYSWLWEGSASITQPIFNGFETYNRIDAAEAREGAADFTMADARQGIAVSAAQAFLNVARSQEALAKAKSYQARIADYLSRINGMVEAGAADEAEAAQAKNIQSQLDNSVAEMEGAVKLALADYVEATGSMPAAELTVGDDGAPRLFQSVEDAVTYANSNHPSILAAQKTLEAEDEEVSAEKGTLLPDLNGELSYLKRDQKEEIGGEVVDSRAVMRMSWGFSTGGAQLARIRQAKAERSEALARTAQVQRQIERDIRKAFAEYETAQKQKELNTKRATVTKELFETYEKQFEAAKVRILQLMQAENQLFTTELEQINAKYRVMMAEYMVLASAGGLLGALGMDDAPVPPKATAQAAQTAAAPEAVEQAVTAPVPTPGPELQTESAPAPAAAAPQMQSIWPAEDIEKASANVTVEEEPLLIPDQAVEEQNKPATNAQTKTLPFAAPKGTVYPAEDYAEAVKSTSGE